MSSIEFPMFRLRLLSLSVSVSLSLSLSWSFICNSSSSLSLSFVSVSVFVFFHVLEPNHLSHSTSLHLGPSWIQFHSILDHLVPSCLCRYFGSKVDCTSRRQVLLVSLKRCPIWPLLLQALNRSSTYQTNLKRQPPSDDVTKIPGWADLEQIEMVDHYYGPVFLD